MTHQPHLIAGSGSHQLAHTLSQKLDLKLETIKADRFPNQELKIRLETPADTAILIGSFSSPVNSRLIEYLLAADALRRMGCQNLIGIITYLAYSKQDKVFRPGEPLSVKVIAKILQTAHFNRLYTIDLHNPSISGYFDIPVINLTAVPTLAEAAQAHLKPNSMVISPDAGSVKNSSRFAEALGLELAFATKHRNLDTGEVSFNNLSHSVTQKNIYIYDDMVATGSTLIQLAAFLKQQGATSVHVYCTHHLYVPNVQLKLDTSFLDSLTVTNTIEKPDQLESPKLHIINLGEMLAHQLASETYHD
jgi:ribose-phosphate pyrophosphokinase